MNISEIRTKIGLSQREFASYFGIPVGTLRNWEQGIASPPDYVLQMIITTIRRDKMINVETIKFTKMLDELAFLSKNGIVPFDEVTQETRHEKVFYDPSKVDEDGCSVVLDAVVIDDKSIYHHDIISYYDSETLEYKVRVFTDEDSNKYITVRLMLSDELIIIEDGIWYFA